MRNDLPYQKGPVRNVLTRPLHEFDEDVDGLAVRRERPINDFTV